MTGGGRPMFTLILTCAISGTVTTIADARKTAPRINFFIFSFFRLLYLPLISRCSLIFVHGVRTLHERTPASAPFATSMPFILVFKRRAITESITYQAKTPCLFVSFSKRHKTKMSKGAGAGQKQRLTPLKSSTYITKVAQVAEPKERPEQSTARAESCSI